MNAMMSHCPRSFSPRRFGPRRFGWVASCILASLTSWIAISSSGRAEEPYQRFLQRLRDERLFDLALVYLDNLGERPGIGDRFRSEIELERGLLLYQSAAVLSSQTPARQEKLDRAEAALKQFLEQGPHPRRGEARLKLGELLLTRAEEAKSLADVEQGEEIPEAVQYYDQAHQFFEATIKELVEAYQRLRGDRIDASDSSQVARRRQLQQDLRQAQLLSAKAVEERGRSRAADSEQRLEDLQQALRMFGDLYSKEQRMIGIRNYALFYRSTIHAELERYDDAVDGFQRIVDQEGVDVLRPLQTQAVTRLVQALAELDKYPVAVDRGEQWLNGLQANEKRQPDALKLRLALARVKTEWSEKLSGENGNDRVAQRLTRSTRTELRSLLQSPGSHLEEARELLSRLGGDPEDQQPDTDELPEVESFKAALTAAQERIDEAESLSVELSVIQEKLADEQLPEEEQKRQREQLVGLQQAIDVKRQQALSLLREALRLFGPEDDRQRLFEARFRIAYVLLKLQRPREALVVSEFLARSNAGTGEGLKAAIVTLSAFSDLIKMADDKSQLAGQLEPFASYLLDTWPQSSEAAAAASALVSLAVAEEDWDKAERFLELVPAGSERSNKLRRDLGLTFYGNYLRARKADAGTAGLESIRERSIKWLELGIEPLKADQYDAQAIEAANALTRLLLDAGRVERAASLLFDASTALTELVEQSNSLAPRTAMETYRTAIQVIAVQLVDEQLPAAEAVDRMQEYVERLQARGEAAPDGQRLLTSIFLGLARDLKHQLANASQPARRERLAEVVLLVVGEAAESNAFSTRYWAADTIVSISQELNDSRGGRAAAAKGFRSGIEILQGILDRSEQDAEWISPASAKTQIKLLLAQAQRGVKDYQAAVLTLGEILDEQNGLLDVQIEAARTLQAWGQENPGFHRLAIVGGRKSSETGQNVIWGWGKISQVTANRDDFSDQFFEARYQLARSRFLYAQSLEDSEKKLSESRKAERDIVSTATLYPQLGGAEQKQRFDALLRRIQQAIDKPATGLAGLES